MRRRKKRRSRIIASIIVCLSAISIVAIAVIVFAHAGNPISFSLNPFEEIKKSPPDELLLQYTTFTNEGKYEDAYTLLS